MQRCCIKRVPSISFMLLSYNRRNEFCQEFALRGTHCADTCFTHAASLCLRTCASARLRNDTLNSKGKRCPDANGAHQYLREYIRRQLSLDAPAGRPLAVSHVLRITRTLIKPPNFWMTDANLTRDGKSDVKRNSFHYRSLEFAARLCQRASRRVSRHDESGGLFANFPRLGINVIPVTINRMRLLRGK